MIDAQRLCHLARTRVANRGGGSDLAQDPINLALGRSTIGHGNCFIGLVDDPVEPSAALVTAVPRDLMSDGAFLAELCHHVRTPLNGILGALELLLDAELSEDARILARAAFQSALDLHQLFESDLESVQHLAS